MKERKNERKKESEGEPPTSTKSTMRRVIVYSNCGREKIRKKKGKSKEYISGMNRVEREGTKSK